MTARCRARIDLVETVASFLLVLVLALLGVVAVVTTAADQAALLEACLVACGGEGWMDSSGCACTGEAP